MNYRLRKQITIASVFFLVLVLIGLGFYFVRKPEASCFDGVKNQNEIEIDCGGVCVTCEVLTLKDIEVNWVKAVSSGNDKYDLVAAIKNPNPNFGAPSFFYEFQLKDQSGKLIGSKEGSSFILPGDSRYLIETSFESAKDPALVNLIIRPLLKENWKKLENDKIPELFVKDKKFSVLSIQPNYTAEATGVVQNNSDFDFDKVYVDILLFNSQNQLAGVSKTEIHTLTTDEGRYFSNRWFYPLDGEVTRLEAEAETNLFLDTNFMRKYGAPGDETEY